VLLLGEDGVVRLEAILVEVLGAVLGRHLDVELGSAGATSLRAASMVQQLRAGSRPVQGEWRRTRGLPMQTTMGDIVGVFCEVGVEKIKRRAELESRARCWPSCPLAEVYLTFAHRG
jgi:hypothetical protein